MSSIVSEDDDIMCSCLGTTVNWATTCDTCRQLTPLHLAAERSHMGVLELLVKHGAKVSV